MMHVLATLSGLASGAALVYYGNQDRGRQRRARAGDQAISFWTQSKRAADVTARDLRHRLTGVGAEMRATVLGAPCDDDVLIARVRSTIGRLVSHPRAIRVEAENGMVTLAGPVLERELDDLLRGVNQVLGVRAIRNALQVCDQAGSHPALQGNPMHKGSPALIGTQRTNWTPTTRLLAGLAGTWLAWSGLRRGHVPGTLMSLAGLALMSRAVTNLPLKRITGVRAGRRAIDVHKTINIDLPIHEAFDFWCQFETFPKLMSHLAEVRDLGAGRSHWVALGPGGVRLAWDAEITRLVPNEILAWRSIPGAMVANAGIIHFEENPDGSTRVDIRMSYNPPLGAVGHAVARFLGEDLKHALDDDLVRLKCLLEQGRTSAHGRQVSLDEVCGE